MLLLGLPELHQDALENVKLRLSLKCMLVRPEVSQLLEEVVNLLILGGCVLARSLLLDLSEDLHLLLSKSIDVILLPSSLPELFLLLSLLLAQLVSGALIEEELCELLFDDGSKDESVHSQGSSLQRDKEASHGGEDVADTIIGHHGVLLLRGSEHNFDVG